MSDASHIEGSFIDKAEAIVLANLADEQFGVSELASAMNMSRSNLLRKIKKDTALSASRFIRQMRLKKGMELLQQGTLTVSEVSYQVGFGSTSYFIKCFREQYGYPPGEVGKMEAVAGEVVVEGNPAKRLLWPLVMASSLILVVVSMVLYIRTTTSSEGVPERSIAVLPFRNESSDSTNLYFVNGLMQSALNNLQKIEDLRVISRTSVEQYRNTEKSAPEIAEELKVNYLVEGSGQRVGDQVLLNIQLIEASTDRPIWSEQYSRKVGDVFAMQNEMARKITDAIEAIVTPAELEQIEKKPTKNLLAYEYYLKALDPYHKRTKEGLEEAIPLFEQAIEQDPQFSLAYANIAISYYFLDQYLKQKQYTEQLNNYADKALLYDSKSAESLIAKALYYLQTEEYRLALPHLEKALEYNPNSSAVVQILADIYARVIPDTGKYLEYALKGIQLDIAANDSVSKSYIYLHLSNALIQTGFVDESIEYINKSLDYHPGNYYSPMVRAYILYAKDGDMEQTKNLLMEEWSKDTTRLDILQEVAKIHYFQEDYENAFLYYEKFVNAREQYGLDIYPQDDIKIARVYEKMGLKEEAATLYKSFSDYCERDQSIYKAASTAVKYAYEGKNDLAIEQLKVFATQNNYQYWILLFFEKDPMVEPLKSHPEFDAIMRNIKDRFWENQSQLKKLLVDKGLL
ncbi:helix-turn-helix domain-containing protein [Flavobacteriaceae bacterium TP-CH-4]|uniref:Helix-turn-helix domain-containing protein n=1 Tax=Pelagihabitans pacificus TaxID=2696054 RepID=A0A967ATE7_9FLAO|nr:helix-turn-helix domain-containing protein [Pelagihabitans pacificus]NHF59963.1 helix-turn-helix domain-containing protein [Pelagihabitans pacificus]